MPLQPFDLRDVTLTAAPWLAARAANRDYLLSLPVDRLLWAFRQNAGLATPGQPLGGWEAPDCEVRGHFVGHWLSACALLTRATGDAQLAEAAARLVAGLGECQRALGGGYLSAWPESFLDRVEMLDRPTWAPLYVIHKILAGLLDAALQLGNGQAWDLLLAGADYYRRRLDRLTEWQTERMLTVEFGGMAEVFYNLAAASGDSAHLELAHRYDQAAFLGPLALGRDNLSYLHGNTQIPKVIGAARRYELTGDERYRQIAEHFWERVVLHRCYAMGGTTSGEIWPEPDRLADTLGSSNAEICKTHNLLKLTRHLFAWTGQARYADYYESAFLNGIWGTQRADNGQMLYYLPLYPGLTKAWGTPTDSFWCCYGTGVETWAKLGDSIAFHDADDLWIHQYVSSVVHWREKGVSVEQRTDYPRGERIALTITAEQPTFFGLRLRLPAWLAGPVVVLVNGEAQPGDKTPGSWLTLRRLWRSGDTVQVVLPMGLASVPMPDDPEMVALRHGPVVLAALDPAPGAYVLADPREPDAWTEPAEQPLTYSGRTNSGDVRLVPLNEVVDEPYAVYWAVTPADSPRHQALLAGDAEAAAWVARSVDRVEVGDAASERAHGFEGHETESGAFAGRRMREAYQGWWRWTLRTVPDSALVLGCQYCTGSARGSFDILINGRLLLTEQLEISRPWTFYRREYAVPADWLTESQWLTVEFRAHDKSTAGGIFDCAVLRAE